MRGKVLAAIALVVGTGGCFFPGDAVMYLQGKLVDESGAAYEKCLARLLDRWGAEISDRPIQPASPSSRTEGRPNASSNFSVLIIYGGYARPVSGEISCEGSKQVFQWQVTWDHGTYEKPLDIGMVVLSRDQ